MKTLNLQQSIVDALKDLPKEKLKEVADFVSSIRDKNFGKKSQPKNSLYKETTELSDSQTKHLEEEFVDYKKLYPLE